MRAHIEIRFELLCIAKPDRAVNAIGAEKQIAVFSQRLQILDFSSVTNLNAEFLGTSLQDLQQSQSRDPGKAVSVNGNLVVAMDHIDIVPRLKLSSDLRM